MHKTREALDAQQEALHINSSLLNKIIEILRSETFNTTDEAGNADIVVSRDSFDNVAGKIVKLFDATNRFRDEPITHSILISLGYSPFLSRSYYCPPPPANGGAYKLEFKETHFYKGEPVKGTGRWIAFLPYDNMVIRILETLGELRDFHKGMCGGVL